ncbi:uncharacterized protein LOC111125375 isoform X2 [Crassostrea virginica]
MTVTYACQGVHLEESTSPISKEISSDLSDFVKNLTNPKQDPSEHAQDFAEKLANPGNKMRLKSTDLSSQLKEKCAISETHDVRDLRQNWRQRMMERRINRTKAQDCTSPMDSFGSTDCEKSFDSVSSSSGNKQLSFHCDSSTEASESEALHPTQAVTTNAEQKFAKKEKDSKKRRFRRMITRPLRRSQSAGWEKDIPTHFMEKSTDEEDTLESRASDLALFSQRLMGNNGEEEDTTTTARKPVYKTCSADAALMAADENNPQSRQKKPSNLAKNMKKKFQFLRRRNTDTAIGGDCHSSPVFRRPSPEQVQKWSRSFDCLLNDKGGIELFRGFLRSEFSEENLEFWIACQEYKHCENSQMLPTLSQKIYGDFVAVQAPKEINLDSKTRMITVTNLEHPTRHTFEDAQKKIQALMEKDSYPRFLESDLYLQLLNNTTSSSKA